MKHKLTKIGSMIGTFTIVIALAGCGQVQSTASSASVRAESEASSYPSSEAVQSEASLSDISSDSSGSDAEITTEKPEINASEIWKKYKEDPDNSTPTYDGDQETATGVITYIGKDDHGTDSMQISDTKGGTSYVLGVFGSAEEMSAVSVGDTVTITGNFHIMSSHDMVVLKESLKKSL